MWRAALTQALRLLNKQILQPKVCAIWEEGIPWKWTYIPGLDNWGTELYWISLIGDRCRVSEQILAEKLSQKSEKTPELASLSSSDYWCSCLSPAHTSNTSNSQQVEYYFVGMYMECSNHFCKPQTDTSGVWIDIELSLRSQTQFLSQEHYYLHSIARDTKAQRH